MYQVFQQFENLLQYKCNTILFLQIIKHNNAIHCNINTAQPLHGDTAHVHTHTHSFTAPCVVGNASNTLSKTASGQSFSQIVNFQRDGGYHRSQTVSTCKEKSNCINGKWVKSLLEHSHMCSINTQLCSYIYILMASGSSLFRVVHLSGADIKQKSYTVFIDTQSKLTMHIIHAQKDCLFTHNERHTTPFSRLVFKGGTKQRRYTGAGPRSRNKKKKKVLKGSGLFFNQIMALFVKDLSFKVTETWL